MEALRLLVQNLIIIVVLVVLMEMLLPEGDMQKYVQTIMGLLVIVAIVQAFSGLSGGSLFKEIEEFSLRNVPHEKTNKNIIERGLQLDANNRQMAVAQYKEGIESQISAMLGNLGDIKILKADLNIQDNPDQKNFGEIQEVTLVLGEDKKIEKIQPIVVRLEEKHADYDNHAPPPPEYSDAVNKAVDTVANFYNIPRQKVKVQFNNS